MVRVLAEPRGKHAAGRPASEYQVVEHNRRAEKKRRKRRSWKGKALGMGGAQRALTSISGITAA
jgi:hypothetical protein